MSTPLNVRRRLSSTIKKFRFDELESSVLPSFPETSWGRIRLKLIKDHANFTVTNALRIIEQTINEAGISEEVLEDRLANLEIIEVSRHHNKKVWYTFTMKGQKAENVNFPSNLEIRSRIVQNFRVHQMEMDVRITTNDGITYVSIRDAPRGKKPKRTLPVFFALFLEHEYIFCSKKNVTKDCIQIMAESLGYTSSKKVKLMGRDLHSLMKMLWMKKQGAVNCGNFCETPELKIAEPVITNMGIDFRQNKQRREYVERCFGEEPPTLESLVAMGPEQSWEDDEIREKIPDEKVQIRWEFRSHNIAATLTKLAEHRVFVMPLPEYVADLMTMGKNDIALSEN